MVWGSPEDAAGGRTNAASYSEAEEWARLAIKSGVTYLIVRALKEASGLRR